MCKVPEVHSSLDGDEEFELVFDLSMFVAQLDPVVPLFVGAALTHAQNDEVPGPVREELVTGLHRQVFETLPPEG